MTTNRNFDSEIYSNIYFGESDTPATWRELCERKDEVISQLQAFRQIVSDLDRNKNGRHEGDIDVGDPSGASQGNPKLHTGDIVGYDISGRPYIMPERADRHNPYAWKIN
jgi:hypothetical protein